MIRYKDATLQEIRRLVDTLDPKWVRDAAKATAQIKASGTFADAKPLWGRIKPVFMALQHHKCIFCEYPLPKGDAGKISHDVEHFRPKGAVKAWPKSDPSATYGRGLGGSHPRGYFWLAYDLGNYAAACKPCNSSRKSSAFPILEKRGNPGMDIDALNRMESPLLLYPLGTFDDDPDNILTFDCVTMIPRHRRGLSNLRARVIIDFFDLNGEQSGRRELLEGRCDAIRTVFDQEEAIAEGKAAARRSAARNVLEAVLSDRSPHAACARWYHGILKSDPEKAWSVYLEAQRLGSR